MKEVNTMKKWIIGGIAAVVIIALGIVGCQGAKKMAAKQDK